MCLGGVGGVIQFVQSSVKQDLTQCAWWDPWINSKALARISYS